MTSLVDLDIGILDKTIFFEAKERLSNKIYEVYQRLIGLFFLSVDLKSLYKKVQELTTSQRPDWQEMAMQRIRKERKQNPEEELQRLRDTQVLTAEREALLNASLNKLGMIHSEEKELRLKALIAEAMEVQKIYGSTHHVFIHAQSSPWLIFAHFVKETIKQLYPDQNVHQFKCLRIPGLSNTQDITEYSESTDVWDSEPDTQYDLISADAYYMNTQVWESALYFLANNSNIKTSVSDHLEQAISTLYPEMPLLQKKDYVFSMMQLSEEDPSTIGNLYTICIPKKMSQEAQYRAHPYGEPCDCHSASESIEILEQLQLGELNHGTLCKSDYFFGVPIPQYRIYTPKLNRENGVRIYLLSSERQYSKHLKEGIKSIVSAIQSYFFQARTA
jgi:hypothetical protein